MRRTLTEEQEQELVRIYLTEKPTQRALGERFHLSRTGVATILRRRGVPRHDPHINHGIGHHHTPEQDEVETIDWLYHGCGLSAQEAARRMGLVPTTLYYRMKRHGIPRRSRSEANRRRDYSR